jgi:hypothetical protein
MADMRASVNRAAVLILLIVDAGGIASEALFSDLLGRSPGLEVSRSVTFHVQLSGLPSGRTLAYLAATFHFGEVLAAIQDRQGNRCCLGIVQLMIPDRMRTPSYGHHSALNLWYAVAESQIGQCEC